MSKITIIEGNSNDKDQIRAFLVKGEKGDKGDVGPIGDNQLTIGTVTSGTTASAEITGTSPNQTLNLVLPKGDKGDKGDKGETGGMEIAGYDEYDSSQTYNTGDYCIYENVLYVCNTDETTGTWDSTKWDATSIKELIDNITDIISTVHDFASQVVLAESDPANTDFWEKDGKVSIAYRGGAITHSLNQPIFTIPEAYRPRKNVLAPFVKGASAYGVLLITASTGVANVIAITSTASTDRLVCNLSYII